MNRPQLPDWTRRVTDRLDQSTRQLDAAALSRLNRIRQAALEQRRDRRGSRTLWPAASVLGSACAVLLAIGIWYVRPPAGTGAGATTKQVASTPSDSPDNDATDSVEFYQDLDFYAWLGKQQPAGGG